eukprot:8427-Pelagococcus_subviridis.AAC.7
MDREEGRWTGRLPTHRDDVAVRGHVDHVPDLPLCARDVRARGVVDLRREEGSGWVGWDGVRDDGEARRGEASARRKNIKTSDATGRRAPRSRASRLSSASSGAGFGVASNRVTSTVTSYSPLMRAAGAMRVRGRNANETRRRQRRVAASS